MNSNHTNDAEAKKVIDILTPKFPRGTEAKPSSSPNVHRPMFRIGSIAATLCICATLAIGLILSVKSRALPASTIVEYSLTQISKADSFRIEFNLRGNRTDKKCIYNPDPQAELVSGTLSILNSEDGTVMTRIDWHDREHNSTIWNGHKYIHLQNGKVIKTATSGPMKELYELMLLNMIPKDIITSKGTSIDESEGKITVTYTSENPDKESINFIGIFSRTDKRLEKAIVRYSENDKNIDLITTNSIDYGIALPSGMFMIE